MIKDGSLMEGYPLRFRQPDSEWSARIVEAARAIFDRPAFTECSKESISDFLEREIPHLLDMHLTSRTVFEEDTTGWTGYTSYLSVNEVGVDCDLAIAAYEQFLLGHDALLSISGMSQP